jgi:hypothetical protein
MSTIKVNTIQDTGTNNAMTISGGVVTFPNNPSGITTPIEIIANNTTGVSNTANIEIDLSTSTNYISQQVILYGVYGSAAADYQVVLRTNGGSYRTGGSDYSYCVNERTTGMDTNGTGGDNAAYMRVNWYSFGDGSTEKSIITMNFHQVGETGQYTFLEGTRNGFSNVPNYVTSHFTGAIKHAEAHDKFKITPSSGNIYVGGYVHYGFRRT